MHFLARGDMRVFKGKISVIMPAYNEGHHIYENLRETHSVFKRSGRRFEIILVDDGSPDATYDQAQKAARELGSIIPVRLCENGGKGNALREGFKRSEGDLVIFLDADLDLHPGQVISLFRAMLDTGADVVIGSKHHPGSRISYPSSRKALSRAYALALKALFGMPLMDTQTGLKVFTRRALEEAFPRVVCGRYAFDVELLAHAQEAGFSVTEAPVIMTFRRSAAWGRIRTTDVARMGLDTLAIFLRLHIIRHYGTAFESGTFAMEGVV
ncbi:MAG: glycosyltransferase family 2 protein [Thermodesulfobacteriota bacterium]|nr:MAG: glycosyltransferase family 2 protein [Thermodesulfobacteriota bacterium]